MLNTSHLSNSKALKIKKKNQPNTKPPLESLTSFAYTLWLLFQTHLVNTPFLCTGNFAFHLVVHLTSFSQEPFMTGQLW